MTTTTHKIANFFFHEQKNNISNIALYYKKSHNIARIRIFLRFRTVSVTSYMVIFHLLKLQLRAFGTFELQSFTASPKSFAHSNLEKLITFKYESFVVFGEDIKLYSSIHP